MNSADTRNDGAPADAATELPALVREAEAAPSGARAPEPVAGTDALVERWWADHFPGSPVGRDTEIWNHAFVAKEDLKRRLALYNGGQ